MISWFQHVAKKPCVVIVYQTNHKINEKNYRKKYEIALHYAAGLWYNAFPMRIILTFMTTRASLYSAFLGGIRRRLDDQYELQTIDYEISDRDLRKVLNFWHPIGCIVVGAEGVRNLTPRAFGTTPVVYIDRTPMTRGNYLDVVQDYEEHGRIAARELLQSDIEDYAFVGNKHPAN